MPGRKANGMAGPYPGEYFGGPPNHYRPISLNSPLYGFYTDTGPSRGRSSRERRQSMDRTYTVDHLVTWSVGPEHGLISPEDGMRYLSKMEAETGIFTMRCTFVVTDQAINIIDGQTREMMEQFPLGCVLDPVAVRDKNGMFNNLILFTVAEEPKNRNSPREMHVFQVVGRQSKDLADDLASAKTRLKSKGKSSTRQAEPPRNFEMEQPISPRGQSPLRAQRLVGSDEEEDVQRGVSLLNRCFDDIERFVLRLKQSVRAFEELGRRSKHSRRRLGDGMLTMRSRAPAPAEFFEIFQKFKLSFNILARLQPQLHNPNSPELIHFLFTPLGLLVEASKDPRHDIGDLVTKVVSPLLTKQAVDLLQSCLTSKEYDFWMLLGEAWQTPRNKWSHGPVAMYQPLFMDGWQPPEMWLESFIGLPPPVKTSQSARRSSGVAEIPRAATYSEANGRSTDRRADRNVAPLRSPGARVDTTILSTHRPASSPDSPDGDFSPWDNSQKDYLATLVRKNAKIFEVLQDRKGLNSKELTIKKGEYLEVLSDERNWWQCSNINGDQGFVPYTLLRKHESDVSNRKY